MLADDVTDADIVVLNADEVGGTLKEIFRNNPDADLIRLADGSVRVNPTSNASSS